MLDLREHFEFDFFSPRGGVAAPSETLRADGAIANHALFFAQPSRPRFSRIKRGSTLIQPELPRGDHS